MAAPTVSLEDPLARVLGETQLRLGAELTWYLETYLEYPFGPHQERAERVVQSLGEWGRQSFEALLGQGRARDFYRDATRNGHAELQLVVVSDDPHVLAWPWEALHDPQIGDLAHHCQIERRLDRIDDPPPLPEGLPRDRVGILLITARPYEDDVAYRSISRPLVELVDSGGLPAEVKLLRPPTFAQLRKELEANSGRYHIVHFDGHGGFGSVVAAGRGGPQGQLVFEKDDGSEDLVTGAQLSQLLREHRIPIAVLNACQSAMLGPGAEDAFASVATALLRAGVRSVVAMGYSLYVSAAQVFLPEFYQRLFASGKVTEAIRAGRQALLAQPERIPGYPLQDWLVPVLYQQDPLDLAFARQVASQEPKAAVDLPDEARLEPGTTPHGLIGRDRAVLALERASRRPPPALLVHGLGGVGKTTLARGYLDWLSRTQGLPPKVIWQSFADVRSFDYVRNRLVEALFGTNAMALPDTQKWPALIQALRARPLLIVWDNFEWASGAADASVDGAMPALDLQALKQWLEQLRGGKTRVLITSRSNEAWLGPVACYRIPLGGLQGEERQALARAILNDLGIRLDPKDQDKADLIDSLQGHPLMMRAILPLLAKSSARQLMQDLEQYVPDANSTDPVEQKLYATLRYVEDGLPPELRPLLYPIGLHEGFVQAEHLVSMGEIAKRAVAEQDAIRVLKLLEMAGLARGLGKNVFQLHPQLGRYLRRNARTLIEGAEQASAWDAGFVTFMGALADHFTAKELHVQNPFFQLFGPTLERARELAENFSEPIHYTALTQSLGFHARNQRNLSRAQAYFEAMAKHCDAHGQSSLAAAAYHQLGMVAEARRDFDVAKAWYRKALDIKETFGDELSAANTYHQLGHVAEEQNDPEAAEAWYRQSLEIRERLRDEPGIAKSFHQLGNVAAKRRDFGTAETWYNKALALAERLGDEEAAAGTFHQLGRIAQDRCKFDLAEKCYRKTLEIKLHLRDEHNAASTYHQLGNLELERGRFDAAEAWCLKSLEIKERLGDEHGASSTYGQLGNLSLARQDLDAAEAWFRKALEIEERLLDEGDTATTHHQLGLVAQIRGHLDAAEHSYRAALGIRERIRDEHGMADSYHHLGMVAQIKDDFDSAEDWFQKSLAIEVRQGNERGVAMSYGQLGLLAMQQNAFDTAEARFHKSLEITERLGLRQYTAQTRRNLDELQARRRKG